MSNIVDAKERAISLDPNRSFLVQAPAGSGKTELLVQRYLKLLGGVEFPEQVLSMTFTRKAAGDMKKRILKALKHGLNETLPDPDDNEKPSKQTQKLVRLALERDKQFDWRLLDNPNRLKILTIDSFCTTIIKQMPILSWMGGPLDIQENAGDLYRDTAKRLLEKVESADKIGKRVRIILKHLDNSKSAFIERVCQLLQKRDQWIIPFFDKFEITDDKQETLENVFSKLVEAVLIELHNIIPNQLKFLPSFAAFAGEILAKDNPECAIAKLANMQLLPDPCIDDLHLWKGLAELLLTKQGTIRQTVSITTGFPPDRREMKNDFIKLLESLDQSDTFIQKLHEARKLPDPHFSDEEWKILKETLLLLPDMAEILRQIFMEQGKTDFTEISLSAREALGSEDNPTDLLLYLDYKYQHILVDEYQDTSYKQYDLLKRLTAGWTPGDGRTMFIVGDPMQSIYRFRDAEVGLFIKTKEQGIGNVNLEFISLKTNFRSQAKVVDWVNGCFNSIFPEKDNKDLGAIEYSPSVAIPEKKKDGSPIEESMPGVVLHATKESSNEVEAIEIANLISSLREKHLDSDIAILVRARNHLTAIVRKLNDRQIRFQAKDIDPLTSRPEIMDLLALMRALAKQTDRVAWLSILRAPWCGLSLEDLHKICADDESTPIWERLQDGELIQTLSLTGRIRLERIIPTLGKTLEFLPMTNFRDVLEGCWIHLGGPAICSRKEIFSDVEVFFDKVSNFLQSNDLSQLRLFQENITDLFANSMTEGNYPVKIMTMHKAKGLEFDFVIIPGLEKTSKTDEKRLVYWMPHDDDLLVAPIEEKGGPPSEIYNFLSHFDRKKSDFETLRLLYVAATRTKTQLHLFGQFKSNDGSTPRKGSLLNKLWPFIKNQWPTNTDSEEASIKATELSKNSNIPKIKRLQEGYQLPLAPPKIETGYVPELQHEPETPEFAWAGSSTRHLGTVMHRCFQVLTKEGKDSWTEDRIKIFEDSLPTALKTQGLPPKMILKEVKKGKIMLRNILNHEKGRWILQTHKDDHCEYPLTYIENNTYQSRVIDRTFIDDKNIRWIIDYKTGQHIGSNLKNFFKNEKDRYRSQLNKYEILLKISGETRPIKKALYYPMHKEFLILE